MKFVYVLISTPNDYLGEKTIISLFSLRRYHNNDYVEIYTDKNTVESIPETIQRLEALSAEIKIESIPSELSQFQRSRFLKTSLRQRVKGDFVYLDLDTVITGDLTELESIECDMALALQHDCLDNNHEASRNRLKRYNASRKVKKDETYGIDEFFNSGVILYRDTPTCRKICEAWHSSWLESSTKFGWNPDQTDLDRINASFNRISILDGKYNCQLVGFRYAMTHLSDCKVIHYFNNPKLSYLKIKRPDYLSKIRETADYKMMENTINSLKSDYVKGLQIMENTQYDYLKKESDSGKKLEAFYTNPIRYPISRLINKFPFLRKQVDLLKEKMHR